MSTGQKQERRAARLGGALGLAICAASAIVALGWALDRQLLRTLGLGPVEMKFNTAAAFMMIGASVALLARDRGGWALVLARMLAAAAGVLGALTLVEYFGGISFGIDEWLFPDPGEPTPGRMALTTALGFVLLATAIWWIDRKTLGIHPSHWLELVVAAIGFIAVLGYLYQVDTFYRVVAATAMALHTAILFLIASAALVLVRPGTRFMRRFLRDDAAGLINRRLLPAAVLVPPTLAWLVLIGQRQGLYATTFAMVLTAIFSVAILVALVWWSAASMQHLRSGQRHLEQANAWQQGMLDSANFTVIATDVDGTIRNINAGAARLLGYRPEDLEGVATPECLHDPDEVAAHAEALSRELGRTIAPGLDALVGRTRVARCDENDWTYIRKDGSRFPVRLSVTAIHDDRGEVTGFLCVGYDITLQKQAEARLVQMARTDILTGLANRAHFEEHLAEALERCDRSGRPMALLFLDLDAFKAINDTLGHHAGDLVLQEFARRLLAKVRTTDLVARLSGDEFVIVLEALVGTAEGATAAAVAVTEAIVASMRESIRLDGAMRTVSASIGVAVRAPHGISGAELLSRADAALYAAKHRGGGSYSCHDAPPDQPRSEVL